MQVCFIMVKNHSVKLKGKGGWMSTITTTACEGLWALNIMFMYTMVVKLFQLYTMVIIYISLLGRSMFSAFL